MERDRQGVVDRLRGGSMDEEVRHLEAVLAGAEQAALRPPAVLGRLAELYLQRGAVDQADRALELAERGLAMVAEGDPLYPKLLHLTAAGLRAVETPPSGALGHEGRAARLDRDAWLLSLDPAPDEALLFAGQWGDWAWHNEAWDEAAEAYEGTATALHRIVLRSGLDALGRLELLSQHAELGPRSAFAYACLNRAQQAVVVLERTGDLLVGYGSQREDLDRLAALGRSDLRDQLLAAMGELAAPGASPDAYGRWPAGRRQAQARMVALVKEIRTIPGLARFSTRSGWADVSEAARSQPVTYLAATDKGTVMLTVLAGGQRYVLACLEDNQQDVVAAVEEFLRAEYEGSEVDPRDALLPALEWLSRIMAHVRQAVGSDGKVRLVPFGILAQLPLQAAFSMLPATDTTPTRMHFWFHPSQVTYAGSARSWVACRARSAQSRGSGALVVNDPAPLPATFDELQLSDFERDVVARHFPITELAGRDATDERILQELPGVEVAHFSCHGTIDNKVRYTGVLLVADQHLLTVQHWAGSSELKARLVFLSSCESGMAALGVAQLTSVPSALVAAGAAAVIATFWHTDEMATLLVVSRFYDLWQGGRGAGLGEALGQAQEWLATSSAATLRAAAPAAALANPAGRRVNDRGRGPGNCRPADQSSTRAQASISSR